MQEWKIGLKLNCVAPTLSQYITREFGKPIPSFERREQTQRSSVAVVAIEQYSASMDEHATIASLSSKRQGCALSKPDRHWLKTNHLYYQPSPYQTNQEPSKKYHQRLYACH
jgi:hypothetical protein